MVSVVKVRPPSVECSSPLPPPAIHRSPAMPGTAVSSAGGQAGGAGGEGRAAVGAGVERAAGQRVEGLGRGAVGDDHGAGAQAADLRPARPLVGRAVRGLTGLGPDDGGAVRRERDLAAVGAAHRLRPEAASSCCRRRWSRRRPASPPRPTRTITDGVGLGEVDVGAGDHHRVVQPPGGHLGQGVVAETAQVTHGGDDGGAAGRGDRVHQRGLLQPSGPTVQWLVPPLSVASASLLRQMPLPVPYSTCPELKGSMARAVIQCPMPVPT